MQASNFQDTSFDVMDVSPADDSFDMTGVPAPSGGGQPPVSDNPLTAPVSGPSSFSGDTPVPAAASPSLPDSAKAASDSEDDKDFYALQGRDPAFDLLLKTGTAQDQLDYEDITAGTKTPEELSEYSPIRAALLLAKRTKGKNALETRNEAEKLGIPVDMAMASPDSVRREYLAHEIEKNLLFAKWASKSKENAAIAREDTAGLGRIFSDLADFATHPDEWGRSLLHWTTQSKNSPVATGYREVDRTAQALGHGITEVGKSFWGGLQMLADHPAFGGPDSMFATALRDARKSSETIEMPKALNDVSGFAQRADQFWLDAVSAIPGMAAAMMATVGTGGVAGPEIGALAGMGVMGHQIAGGDYLKYTEEEGISRERARAAAIFNAAMQAPLENLGQLMFLKAFSSKGYKKIIENWLKAGGAEGVEEYFQKWPEFMANVYAESEKHGKTAAEQDAWSWGQLTNTDNLLKTHQEGLYEAAIGAFLGLLGGSVHLSIEGARLNRAQEFAEVHKKFHEAIAGNQTAVESPATMAEILMENNMEMRRTVHVSANELFQLAGKDSTLLANLGLDEAKVKQDAADGQFYEIPVGVLHAQLNDKAQFEAVFDISRENEEAYSAKEGGDEKFRQDIQDRDVAAIQKDIQKSVELFQKREQDEDAIQAERMRLHQDLTQAILNVSSVREQARAYGGVDKFVNDHLTTMEREARRIAKMSDYRVSASDLLRAVSFQGLDIARYLGDNFVLENFVSPQSGKTVAQEIQGEFEESRVNREFEEASRSDFFDNIETTAPLSDFPTAEEVFRGKEWTPPQRVEKPKKTARYRASEKPVAYNDAKGERVGFRGEEITLVPDGTVLRLPDGSVTAPFKFDPNWWIHGQSGKETRALQTYYWMQQAVAQMGQEAVAEMDGTVATLERLLENGPEVSDIAYRPEKERARADRKTDGKTAEGHVAGRDAVVLTSEGEDNVRYELWELDDLIPSHDATRNFQENTDTYPPDVQPRKYDKDLQEQLKVRTHASGLRPEMILTDNPDPVNGPSIVTQDGVVLGGNSRAMTMQLVYENADKNLDAYLKMLMDKAPAFGFTSEDVAKFQKPVLVRVLQTQLTKKQMAAKAMLYNETPTQALDRLAEGIGRGKRLSNESLSILANRLAGEEYTTLRDFLRSSAAKPFIESIIRDKVLEPTELNKYLEDNGALTIPGQDLVENALAGFVVTDYNVVRALRDKSRTAYNRLLRVVPYLAIAKKKGGAWDISDQLTEALRLLGKPGSLTENLTRGSLLGTEKKTPRSAKAMAYTFQNASSQAELVARFANFAKLATQKVNPLLGVNTDNTPAAAFMESFGRTVAVVDGQPVLHFEQNADRKAYEFVTEHGGSGHRASMALRNISEMLEDNELPAEELERIKGYQGALTKVKGRVDIYAPDKTIEKLLNDRGELFQQAGNIFGSTQIMSDNTYLVTLFRGANLSSIIHETAHVWFEEMERVTQMEGCPEELKADFSKLRGWVGAEADNPLNVEQKEQLARGMEAYMREGKAPADELTDIFSRFKKWLMQIYQTVLQLNVQLTDEVREVFDRMLATEEEIREVYRENEIATRTEEIADALELTGADRKAYLGAAQGVADAAEHRLTRERNADMRQRRRQYTAEAKAAVNGDKLYDLVAGLKDTPLDLDDLKANFGQDVVNALRAKNSGWVKRGSGVIAEELASQYGYDSAEEMVNDLKERGKSRRKAISDYVKDKIVEYDEQHAAEDYIEDNEKIIGHLEMEGQYVAKHVGKENVPRSMIRAAALDRLSKERVFYAMQANKYRNAYRRAISAERRAILKGDFDSALLYNYQARFNFEMAAMARDLKKNLSALRKSMRKFVDNRKYDPRARFAVMALASQHGLMPWNERLADGKDASTFEEWNKDVGERGYWAEVPFDQMWQGESEPEFSNRVEYMTVGDFGTLTHFLKNIVQIERNMHTELRAAQGANLDELAQNLADTIYANRETVRVKTVESDPFLKRRLKDMHASHSKIEVICEALDGRPLGPLWQAIYAPINEAEDNQTRRLRTMREDMKRLFSVYTQKELAKYMTSKQMEEAIGESITMQQRIMVALNMGNEGNLERLRNGHGWTDSQINAIVAPLTERDWRFVESVWDYLDTFRDEAFQLEEDVNGLKPERVEAQPFTITTADGKSLNIKGGYFPIRYANDKANPVVIPEMKLNDAIVNGLGYASIQTKQGALKQRGQVGKMTPLNLSFDVIADHAFNMIHDICYRRAILDVAKIVQHKTLRDAFTTTDASHLYRLFMPWLQDCANEKITMQKWFDPMARWARSATTTMMMGLKFTTMFTQPVGITQSAHVLGGWKYLFRGLRTFDPRKTADMYHEACARSAFMEARLMNYDRDVRDMLKQINAGVGFQKLLNTARSTAFTPMGWFQMYFVDLPTWWAAYDKGIKDYGGDEKQAVAYADHVVRTSQGSGATKDLSAIQRGGEMQRLLTMFYSYFNTLYNVAALHADWASKHHSPAEVWLTFCAAMNLWFVPAILSELVAGRGPDDDDDPWFWAVKQWCNYPLQTIVGFRELGNALLGEYGYDLTPAEMAPKSIYNWVTAIKKAYEGNGSMARVGEKTAEMGGYILRLPMKQVITNTKNFYDWMSDEADFRVRDLFFPKRKNESQRGR